MISHFIHFLAIPNIRIKYDTIRHDWKQHLPIASKLSLMYFKPYL
jgi:hypothetical protein